MSDSAPVASRPTSASSAKNWGALLVIPLACLFAFWPAMHGGWMWDDRLDILHNPLLRDRTGLWRIWFNPAGLYDYYPLKFSVQWVQWQLWGDAPFGYHLTNLALHAASALLVWRVLGRIGIKHAWFGGLLFAVHPLTVESVAWISELKNTLSLPLFLGAVDRYLAYDEAHRRRDYVLALALFLAALLCKTSVVAFPVFLLLYVWWRRGRVGPSELAAAGPFFVLALALGLVTWWFQRHAATDAADVHFNPVGGVIARLACSGSSAAFYVAKAIWPVRLMPIYPQWQVNPPPAWTVLPWLGFAVLIGWSWRCRATWGRHALLGIGWFLLFAAPVLGFVTITSQRFSWVMDHLAYVPLLGLVGLATAVVSQAFETAPPARRPIVVGAGAVLAAALAIGARAQARHFADEETLWTYNTEQNPRAWLAFFSLGKVKQESHRPEAAIADYQTAIRLRPDYADAYYNLGNLRRETGNVSAAIEAYRQAIRAQPNLVLAHGNLAVVLAQSGQLEAAIAECERATAIEPRYAEGHYNLGSLLVAAGRPLPALPHFAAVLQLNPNYPGAENNYAIALADAGRPSEAVAHFERALRQTPQSARLHDSLGNTLRELGQLPAAIKHLETAVSLDPASVDAWFNLGCADAQAGKLNEAAQAFDRALALKPDYVEARQNLAAVRRAIGLPN